MTHPPTECDRALKAKIVTPDDIAKSVSWYEQAWTRINEALPVTVGGTTYTAKWQTIFDYQTLPAWREGNLGQLAVAYVYRELRRLFRGLGHNKASP